MQNHKLSPFNPSLPVKFVIPGYLDGRLTAVWTQEMVNALINYGDYNVFLIEWRNIIPYGIATADLRIVAAEIANYIAFLAEHQFTRPEDVHLIGHSFGAQIAAYTGQGTPNLGRISGLDPARPNFQGLPPDGRLSSDDALFVDVIHSDFNPVNSVGITDSVGHVDFYLNGASPQPGCFLRDRLFRGIEDGLKMKKLSSFVTQVVRYNSMCSHQRSHELFLESIINSKYGCQFVGLRCADYESFANGDCNCDDSVNACAVLGLHADKYFLPEFTLNAQRKGRWFLRTAASKPYCLHQYQVIIQLGSHKLSLLKGKMYLKFHYLLNGRPGIIEFRITPPNEILSSALRMPYVVTLEESVGEIHHISFAWYSHSPENVLARDYLRIPLKYIKIAPIQVEHNKFFYSNHKESFTKYYCHNIVPIKNLQLVTLKSSVHC
ncbi:Pancreatic triacylglycerol lipase-like protein [Leptotrombidium deliense]|uniref:Pancreatic triacylglycerol lipase-like protein n=1 Tax=Leptotrombidium deliense TaxID=299467 RepID=A0A443SNX4_9ACAR|nr:Pancreatic triacylglycerol lipase-like protein [Leptotrombidium deliense]